MRICVTGGAGFIGSALVRRLILQSDHYVGVLDKLTYASSIESLNEVSNSPRFKFEQADICVISKVSEAIESLDPDIIVHLAAETHVDRSIATPLDFIHTNILGTSYLLQAATKHYDKLSVERQRAFRFHQVSTDEVFGTLGSDGLFTESSPYDPRSPYSASKASADHLVRAWGHTYGLPVLITNCSNNYGHYQFPEKLIPLMIVNAINGKPLPVYGDGQNVRDWLHVDDHAKALQIVFETGLAGETYNVGASSEQTNIDVVTSICRTLDTIHARDDGRSYLEQIRYVTDRPGHDRRYGIDASKLRSQLGWKPSIEFHDGLRDTVTWYVQNQSWCCAMLERLKPKECISAQLPRT